MGLGITLLSLSACSGSSNDYPETYVGFEQRAADYTFDKQTEEKDISVTIIAAEKSDRDREVKLSARWNPMRQPVFRLVDTQVVIPAKKKSATARIRVFPKQMKRNEEISLICSPQSEDAKQSLLTIRLKIQ